MNRLSRTLLVSLALSGCPKEEAPRAPPREGKLGAQRCSGQPGPKNPVLPVLQRPFDGHYPVLNLFDHDLPVVSDLKPFVEGDKELTYCGIEALGLAEGFPGYAFAMPEGTPVFAAADGEVVRAGAAPAFNCVLTHRVVDDQLEVDVEPVADHQGAGHREHDGVGAMREGRLPQGDEGDVRAEIARVDAARREQRDGAQGADLVGLALWAGDPHGAARSRTWR